MRRDSNLAALRPKDLLFVAGKTLVVRSGGNQQDNLVCLVDVQNISVNRNPAAAIQNADASDIANAFAARPLSNWPVISKPL